MLHTTTEIHETESKVIPGVSGPARLVLCARSIGRGRP